VNGLRKIFGRRTNTGVPNAARGGDPFSGLIHAVQAEGGLDGLLDQLRTGGLGPAVDSWISKGHNDPVDPAALGAALGPDTVQHLASGAGVDVATLLPMLASFLPQLVNMLTPNGQTPAGGLNGALGGLADLGGLLNNIGGMFGGKQG
jgi:uncharacterized protein YidB (DUF937 family)